MVCDLFGIVKWPFQRLSDLQLGDQKLDYMATFRFHKPSLATIEFTAPLIPPKRPAPLSIQGNPVKLEGLSREIFGVHGCSKARFHLCK